MGTRLHAMVLATAHRYPDRVAVVAAGRPVTYSVLAWRVEAFARGLLSLGLQAGERVALWLPKQVEQAVAAFGTAGAGGVFVPVNSVLKPAQTGHILRDSGAVVLVTSAARLEQLGAELATLPALRMVLLVDSPIAPSVDVGAPMPLPPGVRVLPFVAAELEDGPALPTVAPDDLAALFYTSGSTGRPKGVMLSHLNLCVGAISVAQYLGNTKEDRLLAVLPFSFDYGFSQFTTAFCSGAAVVLHDYLLPRDVVTTVSRESITGLAGVPPLWSALAAQEWPASVADHLRYVTNSGGVLPQAVLGKLRQHWPRTKVFLMYGLTEAFRSTYLPPEQIDERPDSIGQAIPNADVRVLREDGSECAAGEPGELVHSGPLVAQGYWNDPPATAARFRPAPAGMQGQRAVWSGDTAWRDEAGFLYFAGRRDGMLKTSGYRVSPSEVEEVAYATGLVGDAVLVGLPHERLGHELVLFVTATRSGEQSPEALAQALRAALPRYLFPAAILWRSALPRTAHGKFDRVGLTAEAAQAMRGLA
ncbi:MAG: hypothetical protein RJB26_1400 [Pseudomonadota bacterium]